MTPTSCKSRKKPIKPPMNNTLNLNRKLLRKRMEMCPCLKAMDSHNQKSKNKKRTMMMMIYSEDL